MTARRLRRWRHRAAPARRGWVLAATGTAGAGLLGISLSTRPGSPLFYTLTMGLAGTWAAGAVGSGSLPPGRPGGPPPAHPVIAPVLTGAAAFGGCYAAARLARRIPPLNRAIGSILHYADDGSAPLVMLTTASNAVAEELFFRGALWSAARGRHPMITTTVAYTAATAASRNPALVLAGTVTSVVFGWQRQASGGVLAPSLAHVTWSLLMLRYLPPLFRTPPPSGSPAPP